MARDRGATSVRSRKRLRFSFSGEHLELDEIGRHHNDIDVSVRRYFSPENVKLEVRFAGYTPDEVKHELASILDENGRNMSMNVLAALEAALRIDFIQRGQGRWRDELSRDFRGVSREKGERVSLEDDILPLMSTLTRLLHKSWHVIVTRSPTFRVANASQNSPCSIRPCHDCRPIASVAYPHQR